MLFNYQENGRAMLTKTLIVVNLLLATKNLFAEGNGVFCGGILTCTPGATEDVCEMEGGNSQKYFKKLSNLHNGKRTYTLVLVTTEQIHNDQTKAAYSWAHCYYGSTFPDDQLIRIESKDEYFVRPDPSAPNSGWDIVRRIPPSTAPQIGICYLGNSKHNCTLTFGY